MFCPAILYCMTYVFRKSSLESAVCTQFIYWISSQHDCTWKTIKFRWTKLHSSIYLLWLTQDMSVSLLLVQLLPQNHWIRLIRNKCAGGRDNMAMVIKTKPVVVTRVPVMTANNKVTMGLPIRNKTRGQ